MASSPAVALPMSTLDDDAWDDLLSFIEERRVIPIVGPELLMIPTDRGPRLLYDWAAEKLISRLNVNPADLPQPYTLNDVVCLFLAARGRREEAYVRLRSIIKDANFEPPAALRQLAAISDFDLFVSTTADSLLESAINLERFEGAPSAEVLSYSPNRVVDLPVERDRLQRPLVYHLFGKLSASPTYVISDEDLLEFICALQSEHLVPEKLFYELEHNHLLFIGSNFTNWLARLFLRMAKRQRLSDPRDVGEVLADDHSSQDDRLVAFLQQVSVRTRIYTGAERFVEELHRRWQARRKPAAATADLRRRASCRRRARCLTTPSSSATRAKTWPPCSRSRPGSRRPASPPGSTWTDSRSATTTTARSSATSRAAPTSSRSCLRPRSGAWRRTSAASGAMRSTARATWRTARCSSCR